MECKQDIDNMIEVTEKEIYNAMLVPGEYKKIDGKYYVKRGMLDGLICGEYYKMLDKEN